MLSFLKEYDVLLSPVHALSAIQHGTFEPTSCGFQLNNPAKSHGLARRRGPLRQQR
jgi:hypothetical protein